LELVSRKFKENEGKRVLTQVGGEGKERGGKKEEGGQIVPRLCENFVRRG